MNAEDFMEEMLNRIKSLSKNQVEFSYKDGSSKTLEF